MARSITRFDDFWLHYLREHSRPATRALHYIGTFLVLAVACYAGLTDRWGFLLALPLVGYGLAWAAHFAVEKNRPATFTYPFWSLACDFKMAAWAVTGRLGAELRRAGVEQDIGKQAR